MNKFIEILYPTKIFRLLFFILEHVLLFLFKIGYLNHKKIKFSKFLFLKPSAKIGNFIRNHEKNYFYDLNEQEQNKVKNLFDNGYTYLGNIGDSMVNEATEYFYKKKIYNAHMKAFSNDKVYSVEDFLTYNNSDIDKSYASYDQIDSINFLNRFEIIKKLKVDNIIKSYFDGHIPDINSIETMISRPQKKILKYIQTFHRDFDSVKGLVLFIYWTDTNKSDGATQIIPGSHKILFDEKEKWNEENILSLESKKGDVFLMDPLIAHRGSPSIKNPRLVTWLRMSYLPSIFFYLNRTYKLDKESSKIFKYFK